MSFEGRRVSEPSALRALSHPLRLRLIELLQQAGPLTATEAAAHVGSSPSNCSFHLRQLAKYGYVTEAEARAGRNRPWRRVDPHVTVPVDELDQAGREALPMLISAAAERYRMNVLNWHSTRNSYSKAWRSASGDAHRVLRLTVDELAHIRDSIASLIEPYLERTPADDGPDTVPIAWLLSAVPLSQPTSSDADLLRTPRST